MVWGNLAKKKANCVTSISHARNFPFMFNVKLHACANVEIFCKILLRVLFSFGGGGGGGGVCMAWEKHKDFVKGAWRDVHFISKCTFEF